MKNDMRHSNTPHHQNPHQPQQPVPNDYSGQQQDTGYQQVSTSSVGPDQPVAYDQYGNPLYARPQQPQPQQVYMSRPLVPETPHIPEEVQRLAQESAQKYKHLNLSQGEYVIRAIRRHPIGILQIWAVVILLMVVFGGIFWLLFSGPEGDALLAGSGNPDDLRAGGAGIVGVFFVLFALGGMVATYIYNNNRFYLTNESVIQEIQTSLFAKHEQTVSLSNVEDASYKQTGIMQHMLNYGTIRLSTEGDETTYRFTYVTNPKRHIAVLNNAVEAFKNGRPVHSPGEDQPS